MSDRLVKDEVFKVKGRVTLNEDAPPDIVVEEIDRFVPEAREKQMFLRLKTADRETASKIKELAGEYPGSSKVKLYVEELGRTILVSDRTDICPGLERKLEELIGSENVVVR